MFLFIWVNYLNVSLMDFVFLEPSDILYIAYFVELCFLAIFSLLEVISRASSAVCFSGLLGRCHTFQKMKTFSLKVFYPE